MSDTSVQYLNLDEVEPSVQKILTIKGVKHEFKQPSVGEFIEEMKRVRELQKKFKGKEDVDQFEVIEVMIDSQRRSVKNAFPTIPDDVLNDLTQDQLNTIRDFIEKQFNEENAEARDEAGNAQAAEGKSKQ